MNIYIFDAQIKQYENRSTFYKFKPFSLERSSASQMSRPLRREFGWSPETECFSYIEEETRFYLMIYLLSIDSVLLQSGGEFY